MRFRSTIPFVIIVAAACSRHLSVKAYSDPRLAGAPIIQDTTPKWTAGTAWQVDSTPITVVGGVEPDSFAQFTFVGHAIRLHDGRVVVATMKDVRWFDSSGRYLMTSGRRGRGPGEFNEIGQLVRLTGDSIIAGDDLSRKLAIFAPDGHFTGEELVDGDRFSGLGHWGECPFRLFPDRSRIACQQDKNVPESPTNRTQDEDPGPGLLRQLVRLYLIPPTVDAAHPIGVSGQIEQFGVSLPGSNITRFFMSPLYSSTLVAWSDSPRRIIQLTNPEYELSVWTMDGRIEKLIRRARARRPPTPAELAAARAWTIRMEQHGGSSGQYDLTSLVNQMELPDTLPAGVALAVTDDGMIVLQRDGAWPGDTESHFDVFAANGHWLGTLRLPEAMRLLDAGRDYLLGVHLDDDDQPHVKVWRVRRR